MKPLTHGQIFFIAEPKPGDKRKRNAFGILEGFGKAYSAYYKKQDEEKARIEQWAHEHCQEVMQLKILSGWSIVLSKASFHMKQSIEANLHWVTLHSEGAEEVNYHWTGVDAGEKAARKYEDFTLDTLPVFVKANSHRAYDKMVRELGRKPRGYAPPFRNKGGKHRYELHGQKEYEKVRGIKGIVKSKLPEGSTRTWNMTGEIVG